MQLFSGEFSGKTPRPLSFRKKDGKQNDHPPDLPPGRNSSRSGSPSRYLRLKTLTQKTNIASISGPKMTPIKPKSDRPMKTPKMVMSGCKIGRAHV